MPRNSGVEILGIKPDAEMGLAQDTNIPVPAVELTEINRANDQLRIYDHQINLFKYEQKIKDRDKLLQGLEANQVAVGDIEPEDKKYFDEAEKKYREAFLNVKSLEPDANGQNKEYESAMAAFQDLKDESVLLQARRVALQTLRKELASTISPAEKKARIKHLDEQKAKDPYKTVTPFQKSLTVNLDKTLGYLQNSALISGGQSINTPQVSTVTKDANGKITTTTTQKPPAQNAAKPVTKTTKNTTVNATSVENANATGTTAASGTTTGVAASNSVIGSDGYLSVETIIEPEKKWSLDVMKQNAAKMYMDPEGEGLYEIQSIFDSFNGNPDDVPKEYLKTMNERLALYHQQNGIGSIKIPDARPGPVDPNNPADTVGGFVDTGEYEHQINYQVLPDGRIVIKDNPADFAAKLALANVSDKDYVIKEKKGFSEENFKLNMLKAKNKAEILLAGAKANTEKAKGAWYWGKVADLKDDEEKEKVLSDGWVYNIVTQDALAIPYGNGYYLANIPARKSTPVFTYAAKKEGEEAKATVIKPIGSKIIYGDDMNDPATYGKVVGYEGGEYKPQYVFDGKAQDLKGLIGLYETFKQRTPNWNEGFDSFLKKSVAGNYLEIKLEGENGATTKKWHTNAAKAISNKNSKKGQDQPFYEQENQ